MQKLYCYVDETGQDTKGELFIVSVVVVERERSELVKQLKHIEHETGKGRTKWRKTRDDARVAYIRQVFKNQEFKGKLTYALHKDTTQYLPRTVLTVARSITLAAQRKYKATILVDGLPKSQTRWFGKELRHLRIRTRKVRGIRKEETDALLRLADALCGFVRAALSGRQDLAYLLEKAKREGYIREL